MKRFVNLLIGMLVVLVCFVIQTAVLRGSSILSFRPNLLREGRTLIRGGSDGQK